MPSFADDATRVTRLARTAVASLEPDVVEVCRRPRSRRPQLVTALRVLPGMVGLGQVEMALAGMLGPHTSVPGTQGVMLQGASLAPFAHESVAWNLALGVGFLWVAWRSSRTSGMIPTLATFLAVLVAMDAMAGGVDVTRLLGHLLVLLGLVLMILLDRLPRPAGSVPGTRVLRQRRLDLSSHLQPVIDPGPSGLPPDLRPTGRHHDRTLTQRRTA